MKRRIFSVFLALALCLGLLPGTALAAEEEPCVIIAGYRLTAEETNDTTIEEGYYPYTYARVDEDGVTVVDITEDQNFNVVLQNWYGNLYLILFGAEIPGATRIKGEEHLSTGGIKGGAGIYCEENLNIELMGGYGDNIVHTAVPEEGQAQGEVFAIYVEGNLEITSRDYGTLTATSASTPYEKGSSHGIYAHGHLAVTGSAEVTAIGGKSSGGSAGVQALTTIEVVSEAKLTGIGGESESCIGISCDKMSVWNQAEVIGKAEAGTATNTGISFNTGDQHGLTIAGKSRVTAIAGGSPSMWSIGITVPYLSSSYFQYFPIKLVEGSTELDGSEYINEAYLEVHGTSSSSNGYAFDDTGILFTYEGGTLIASGTTDLCRSWPGIKINSWPAEHIWRTDPDGDFKFSDPDYFVYQYPYDKTYLEITPGYQVTAESADETMGTVSGGGGYKGGSSATVEATAKPGYQFACWTENGSEVSTENPYIFPVTGDKALTAEFEELPATGIQLDASTLAVAEGSTKELTVLPVPDGAKLEGVTWTSSDPAVATVDENGVVTGVKAGTATITVTMDGFTAVCAVTVNPVEPVPVRPPELPPDTDDQMLKVVMETGLSQVPEGLQEKFDTPAAIETQLKTEIKAVNPAVPEANTAVYDVELLFSTDGGTTWEKATKDNFPAGGLTLTLPYPEGTGRSYAFTVVHMFTMDNGTGKGPGDTETPKVTNTDQGIRFTVTGLSPISVGWTEPQPVPSGGSGSDSDDEPTYAVTVEKPDHGKVTANRQTASQGSAVTLTVTPDSGYVLDTLTVTNAKGSVLKLTGKGSGKYTFTMPGGKVSVEARFVLAGETHDCPSLAFADLNTSAWYHEAVDYVLSQGVMGGYGAGRFGPNEKLSRAQLAQLLYNLAGRPAVTGASPFTDVADGAWCADAVIWASANNIVSGYGDGRFAPDAPITREQLAVMLYRYEQHLGGGFTGAWMFLMNYSDVAAVSDYAYEAMCWCTMNGVIHGYADGRLNPKGPATRAQAAQMLMSFLKNR